MASSPTTRRRVTLRAGKGPRRHTSKKGVFCAWPRDSLPLQEAADAYGVSSRSIRRYITDGRLTAYRIGPKMIRLDAEEVERQLLGNQVGVK